MNTFKRQWALLAATLLLVAFGWLVWPTLYRYDHMDTGVGQSYPVRTNRITGSSSVLYPSGWAPASQVGKPQNPDQDLTPDELRGLDGEAKLSGSSAFKLKLYNGSRFKIEEIKVEVSLRNTDHRENWRRSYLIQSFPVLRPEQTGYFEADLGSEIDKDDSWVWRIVAAKGIPTPQVPTHTPHRSDAEYVKYVLSDPKFWKLSQTDQRVVIGTWDWEFATKSPSVQEQWLKLEHEKFLRSH